MPQWTLIAFASLSVLFFCPLIRFVPFRPEFHELTGNPVATSQSRSSLLFRLCVAAARGTRGGANNGRHNNISISFRFHFGAAPRDFTLNYLSPSACLQINEPRTRFSVGFMCDGQKKRVGVFVFDLV